MRELVVLVGHERRVRGLGSLARGLEGVIGDRPEVLDRGCFVGDFHSIAPLDEGYRPVGPKYCTAGAKSTAFSCALRRRTAVSGERKGGGRSDRAVPWTGHRCRCLPFAHTPDSASSAAGYDPRTRTIWLSVRRASSGSCVRGSFASASRSTQKTYSQRAVREGRDSSFERLRPCSAKAPRLRCSEPGTFQTANTRVVFIGVRLRSPVANARIHSGANGSRARTANRVRLSCPVWMSPARTSSP